MMYITRRTNVVKDSPPTSFKRDLMTDLKTISDNCIDLNLKQEIPLFKKQQPVFDEEIREGDTQKIIEMGLCEGQQFETQEAHIREAATSDKKIPIKAARRDPDYHVQGHIPLNNNYFIYNLQQKRENILYDPTDEDYEFLDSQSPPIPEDHFEFVMTVLDLLFPTRYHNIAIGGYGYFQIEKSVQTAAQAPERYLLNFTAEELKGLQQQEIRKIYDYFCEVRDKKRLKQPLMLHLSTESIKRKDNSYFRPVERPKKAGKFNSNTMKQNMNIFTYYNILGEFVVARELLNSYNQSLKYLEGLFLIEEQMQVDNRASVELLPEQALQAQLNHYLNTNKLDIPNVNINPVYPVQIGFKPYQSAQQLRKQHERCIANYVDRFKPVKDMKGESVSTKKDTNEFLQFYNDVMDCIEEVE